MATLSHLSIALSLSKTLTPSNSSSLSLFFPIPSAFNPPIPDSSRPDVSLSPLRCSTPHALRPPIMTSTLAIYPVRCPTSGSRSPFFSATTSIAALHSASSTPPGIPTPLSISKSSSRYVVEKDVKNNVVFVSRNYFSLDKRRRLFRVGSLKWLGDSIPIQMSQLRCKVRHGPGFYNCSLAMEFGKDGKEVAVVQIFEDDQGLAARQFAAFYEGRTCLGSGVILESWDNQGFPVCAKALEVAAMGDKSKLGKLIKIKAKQEEACGMESEQKDCVELEVKLSGVTDH